MIPKLIFPREASTYLALVDAALRGDLETVQRLVRSQAGTSLYRTMRSVDTISKKDLDAPTKHGKLIETLRGKFRR